MFPIAVDSTMRSAFVDCAQKFKNLYIDPKVTSAAENVNLLAGKAFAKGLHAAKLSKAAGLPNDDATGDGIVQLAHTWGDFEPPEDEVKSLDRMIQTLDYYLEQYPYDTDPVRQLVLPSGKIAAEIDFALPLPNTQHPETGEPILYAGRIDWLGKFGDMLLVVDEKTTKQLGVTWSQQWTIRGQFIGYTWGMRQFGHPVVGTIIRGICIRAKGNDKAEAIVYAPQWLIDRWLGQVVRDVNRMIQCYKENYWDWNFGSACSSYGGCQFMRLCSVPDESHKGLVELYYKPNTWNPLQKD